MTSNNSVQVHVYMTKKMKFALEEAAEKEGRSLSNFLQHNAWKRAKELGVTLNGDDTSANESE